MTWTAARHIGPLKPFTCSYKGPDGRTYGITLYATDEAHINLAMLPGLTVDGVLDGWWEV